MQITLEFHCKDLQLPIHYNYMVQSFIYRNLKDAQFSEFLHNTGFKNEKRTFKLFTFSRLEGKYTLDMLKKTITFQEGFSITIASAVEEVLNNLISTCLFAKNLELNNQPIKLTDVKVQNQPVRGDLILVKTLSPIVTYSTEISQGKKTTIYYGPRDDVFNRLILENLKKKAKILGIDEDGKTFYIKAVEGKKVKENITTYKNFIIKGWSGLFQLQGSPQLIQAALDCGLGSKNAQGYGCIKLIRHLES